MAGIVALWRLGIYLVPRFQRRATMRARTFILVALLAAVPLAGCAENDTKTTPTPATSTTPTSTTPTATTPTATSPAVDPTPTISKVKVGSDAAYPPFENTVDGEIVGFDVDVFVEIGNRSGFQVEFTNALFDAIIPAVQSGEFDAGMSAFTITDARKEQVDFSVSYYDNELMAAVGKDTTGIDDAEDLRGKRVCTQKGTTSETYLRETVGLAEGDLMLLDTFPPCVDAVKVGEAVALMIDRAAVRDVVAKSNGDLKEAFTVAPDPPEQFGIAVEKGNTALLVAINTALTAMKNDGTLDKLADKWNV